MSKIPKWQRAMFPACYDGLSNRAMHALSGAYIETKEEAVEAIQSGKLTSNRKSVHNHRNFGWKTYKEICVWAGLPEPQKSKRVCPHCGGLINPLSVNTEEKAPA